MTNTEEYAKGYRAGVKKGMRDQLEKQIQTHRTQFIERAVLEMLPIVFGPNFNWGPAPAPGDRHVPYKTVEERINFAWEMARKAWDKRVI